jgi:hypothetical protein
MVCGLILFLFLRSFGVCWWAGKQHVQRKVSGEGRRRLPRVHLLLPSPLPPYVPPRSPEGPATTSQAHARRSRDKLTAADFKRLRQTLTRARTFRLPDGRDDWLGFATPFPRLFRVGSKNWQPVFFFFFFEANFRNLANYFSKFLNKKQHHTTPKNLWFKGIFSTFFEIIIIKLATSRPKHFLDRQLKQHFCKNATAHLG